MYNFYLEITTSIYVDNLSDQQHILGKATTRLHGILKSKSLNAGIDFPKASFGTKYAIIGNILRIFSDREVLEVIKNNSGINNLINRHMINVSELQKIPKNAYPVQNRRKRKITKHEAYKRAKKHYAFLKAKGGEVSHVATLAASMHNKIAYPYFVVCHENGRPFAIHFETSRWEKDIPQKALFSTYGLSYNGDGVVWRF